MSSRKNKGRNNVKNTKVQSEVVENTQLSVEKDKNLDVVEEKETKIDVVEKVEDTVEMTDREKKEENVEKTGLDEEEQEEKENKNNGFNSLFKKGKNKPLTKGQKIFAGCMALLMLLIVVSVVSDSKPKTGSLPYVEFMAALEKGDIDHVVYTPGDIFVKAVYKEGVAQEEVYDPKTEKIKELTIVDNCRVETVLNPSDEEFFKTIAQKGVEIQITSDTTSTLLVSLISIIPTVILIALLIYMLKMQFGNNMNAKSGKLAVKSKIKFSDVAGMTEEKEELLFAIKSLNNQEDYVAKGVKPVRGILLEGPPGVGKTLLAKAVAGEAGVNFLSYSGSDFVEMFVGLGARRVRSMFEEAEKLKPCVIFIDEIDALGRKRIAGGNGGTQEADQTLVALLERMDGMNTSSGILFIAATNRIDALDSALLRPGRFDKTIHVSPPKTKEDREAIVTVHSKDKVFGEGVTVEKIAKQCYGLTGAEIASALNDAVLESFKADRNGVIELSDIDKAIMKLYAKGLAKGRHSEKDLYRVAVHEVGHALMNRYLGREVVKVSIQPYSSGVGGVTQIDGENSGLDGVRTKTDIINDIKVLYGGKAAEEIVLGECSIGASNDLERATYAIRDYIGAYGMQEGSLLSLVGLSRENMMISANEDLLKKMEEVANSIYTEVIDYLHDEKIKDALICIAKELAENEVIYDFESVANKYLSLENVVDLNKEDTVE